MTPLDAALWLASKNYSAHWLRLRSKAPICRDWAQLPVMSPEDLRQTYQPGYNVGVRCGRWSQPMPGYGLVVLDVDIKTPDASQPALAAVETLCDIEAPTVLSGGGFGSRHLWGACPLALLPPKATVTILQSPDTWIPPGKDQPEPTWKLEVLSSGKNLVVPPSIHPDTGDTYRWLRPLTPTLPALPEAILEAVTEALAARVKPSTDRPANVHTSGTRPGDDFNRAANWRTILESHGWVAVRERAGVTHWRRPGKDTGISATTNYADSGLLYVFSSNAAPFEPDTAYTPFAAVAMLEHAGDYRAAAKALHAKGYGRRRDRTLKTSARLYTPTWPTKSTERNTTWRP